MNRSEPGDLMLCPFCGERFFGRVLEIRASRDVQDALHYGFKAFERRRQRDGSVNEFYCTKCQAFSSVEFGRKENLVSKWNSRHKNLTKYAPHQLRVIDEKQELDEKREASTAELRTENERLREALAYMLRAYDLTSDTEDILLTVIEGAKVFSVASARAVLSPQPSEQDTADDTGISCEACAGSIADGEDHVSYKDGIALCSKCAAADVD